jgi:DNA-binding transcriptional LysR family regulator
MSRTSLIGQRGRRRLDRLVAIAGHASIFQAAQATGTWPGTLHEQVARLESACGGPVINRCPRPAGTAILTPLGKQLCQQARDYLGHQPAPGRETAPLPAN